MAQADPSRPHAGASIRVADVEHSIDSTPIGSAQWRAIALCAALSMIDGFDVQAMAFVAPDITARWALPPAALGPVFSAGILGAAIGAFLLGPLVDRTGPKRILVIAAALFASFSLLTSLAAGIGPLIVLRVLAGIGMGGAVPALLSLLSAFSPRRLRATIVTIGACCQMLGATLGGLLSAELIPRLGWPSVFWLGGALPLLLLPLLIVSVPESPVHLARRRAAGRDIERALRALGKNVIDAPAPSPVLPGAEPAGGASERLFAGGRGAMSLFYLIGSFFGVAFFFFLANWVPTILRSGGASLGEAVLGGVALNAGGFVGAILFARLMDRFNPFPIVVLGFLLAGIVVPLIGHGEPLPVSLTLLFVVGFGGLGAIYAAGGLVVLSYPPQLHGSALGGGIGVGRIGSVIAPLLGSALLLVGAAPNQLYYIAAFAGLAASLSYWRMGRAAA
jgi:AAHS family 4-hydroxybenzoate transporter-like MFS transporter